MGAGRRKPGGWRVWRLGAALGALALGALPGASVGHSWYPSECCSDRDCAEARGEPVAGGYRITAKDGRSWIFDESAVRRSEDGHYHLCIMPGAEKPLCAFVPLAGA